MSTLAEQIEAVKRAVWCYDSGAAASPHTAHVLADLRDALATLEGMAAPGEPTADVAGGARVRITLDLIVKPLPPEKLAEHAREMTSHPETFDSPGAHAAAVERTLAEIDTAAPTAAWFIQRIDDIFTGNDAEEIVWAGSDYFCKVDAVQEVKS